MSWADFYRRRDAIDHVLTYARRHPAVRMPFDELHEVPALFDSKDDLALALQYKWSRLLTGSLTVALADAENAQDADYVDAVATAWRTTARQHPELRRLLDGHADTDADDGFRAALRTEQRTLAHAAGLAEAGEPADATARIGAAFLTLIRGTSGLPTGHAQPVELMFHRLVPSA
ncbi:MAG TPA: hypothetical protein VFX16_28150 [Pseudonocardiaceae bacterium]|nr:hypothetical protein [Pseudonocardiaceae bacterium]